MKSKKGIRGTSDSNVVVLLPAGVGRYVRVRGRVWIVNSRTGRNLLQGRGLIDARQLAERMRGE